MLGLTNKSGTRDSGLGTWDPMWNGPKACSSLSSWFVMSLQGLQVVKVSQQSNCPPLVSPSFLFPSFVLSLFPPLFTFPINEVSYLTTPLSFIVLNFIVNGSQECVAIVFKFSRAVIFISISQEKSIYCAVGYNHCSDDAKCGWFYKLSSKTLYTCHPKVENFIHFMTLGMFIDI
jgi:hypothetical protein